MSHWDRSPETLELLELLIEERISPQQFRHLEDLIRADADARRFYLEYLDLHGMLHWGSALAAESKIAAALAPRAQFRRGRLASVVAAIAVLFVAVGVFAVRGNRQQPVVRRDVPAVESRDSTPVQNSQNGPAAANDALEGAAVSQMKPIQLPGSGAKSTPASAHTAADVGPRVAVAEQNSSNGPAVSAGHSDSHEALLAAINADIRRAWDDNEVEPSVKADDAEWLRRVHLDVVGHIPTAAQVQAFQADQRANKRELVIDGLLDHEDYVRNWSTIWTNLLIGRSNPRGVNRAALQKFLRESFRANRGWDDIVTDMVAAEGSADENGAANFLLAHVNNQAVPATAITARLFLCQQVQCTQCHDHPFNDLKQGEFWAFNSFFKEVKVIDRPRAQDPQVREVVLTNQRLPGPTYYETRSGIMKAAYPRFEDVRVDFETSDDLRAELARLMAAGEAPQLARAFVNRMWRHFLGAAFTTQVDDMGPHARVSHPGVLDRLTREFVRSGYDVKQLIRWICRSEPYQLTSRFGASNSVDDPLVGNDPLFSRTYVKMMSVEQAFDSLLVATDAREVFGSSWEAVEQKRQEWLQQFVMAFGTDENDEADLFEGSIPQALTMMNGELIQLALQNRRGTYLEKVVRSKSSEDAKIESIALAALSRKPNAAEVAAAKKLIREYANQRPRGTDPAIAITGGLQDLFWAYLNSNEFMLIH